MIRDLERQDLAVIASGLLVALAAILVLRRQTDPVTLILIDNLTQYLAALAYVVSAVFIYLVHTTYGGEVGRALEVMGIGLLISAIWAPYVTWHIIGAPDPLGPAWLGLLSEWWGTFFHTIIVTGYGVVVYGFYLFWQSASVGTVADE